MHPVSLWINGCGKLHKPVNIVDKVMDKFNERITFQLYMAYFFH